MIPLAPSNFSFHDWQDRRRDSGYEINASVSLPLPPDTYCPGHCTWGADPKRSRAIIHRRERKKLETNRAFFEANVLPLIADRLNPVAWKDLGMPERGGFRYWTNGKASAWIHVSDTEREGQAAALGATPQDFSYPLQLPCTHNPLHS